MEQEVDDVVERTQPEGKSVKLLSRLNLTAIAVALVFVYPAHALYNEQYRGNTLLDILGLLLVIAFLFIWGVLASGLSDPLKSRLSSLSSPEGARSTKSSQPSTNLGILSILGRLLSFFSGSSDSRCKAIIKSGSNEGRRCRYTAINNGLCGHHS